MSDIINIFGKLEPASIDNILTESKYVHDSLMNDNQENINKKVKTLYEAYSNGELGGSDGSGLTSKEIAAAAMTWGRYGNIPWVAKLELSNSSETIELYNKGIVNQTIYLPVSYDAVSKTFKNYDTFHISNISGVINYDGTKINHTNEYLDVWTFVDSVRNVYRLTYPNTAIQLNWTVENDSRFKDIIIYLRPTFKSNLNNNANEMYINGDIKELILKKEYPIVYGNCYALVSENGDISSGPNEQTIRTKNINGNNVLDVPIYVNEVEDSYKIQNRLYFYIPNNVHLFSAKLGGIEIALSNPITSTFKDTGVLYKKYVSVYPVDSGTYNIQLNLEQ